MEGSQFPEEGNQDNFLQGSREILQEAGVSAGGEGDLKYTYIALKWLVSHDSWHPTAGEGEAGLCHAAEAPPGHSHHSSQPGQDATRDEPGAARTRTGDPRPVGRLPSPRDTPKSHPTRVSGPSISLGTQGTDGADGLSWRLPGPGALPT